MIKPNKSEFLWRWGLIVVTDEAVFSPEERLNLNVRGNEMSAKGGDIVYAAPNMTSGPENLSRNSIWLRGDVEETRLEHRIPV